MPDRLKAPWVAVIAAAVLSASVLVWAPTSIARTPGPARSVAAPTAGVAAGSSTDFNGDGRSDILWHSPSGTNYVWTGRADGTFASRALQPPPGGAPVIGDFDGNGTDDVVWYAPGAARDEIWYGTADGFRIGRISVGGSYRPVVGDFDGNGADDIVWYAPGGAQDYVWWGSAGGFSSVAVSVGGDYRTVVGDFDGDGADDVLWYAPGGVQDYVWWGRSNRRFSSGAVSVGGDYQPIPGDFDGDGRTDVVWYGAGPAPDYVWDAGPRFSSRPITINGRYQPVARGVPAAPPAARPLTSPYASAGGVSLNLPSPSARYIGYHQSASPFALTQSARATPVRASVMPSRNRGTEPNSAADIVMPHGAAVLAPVSGVVIEARGYALYGRYGDAFVAIAPDGFSGEVLVLHISGLRVRTGDRVIAGVTEIASSAHRLPFGSQVDLQSGYPSAPHVHVEVSALRGYRAPSVFG